MEAAQKNNSPVIIQASNGGGQFYAGKAVKDPNACAAGAVAMALHVRAMVRTIEGMGWQNFGKKNLQNFVVFPLLDSH